MQFSFPAGKRGLVLSEVDKPSLVKLIVGGGLTRGTESQGLDSLMLRAARQGRFRLTSLFLGVLSFQRLLNLW